MEDAAAGRSSATVLPPISQNRSMAPAAAAVLAIGRRSRSDGSQRSVTGTTLAGTRSQPLLASAPIIGSFVSGGSHSSAGSIVHDNEVYSFPGSAARVLQGDTVQMWRHYRKQATAHEGRLVRGPRWRNETRIVELAGMREEEAKRDASYRCVFDDVHTEHIQSRRALQRQLREAKDLIHMDEKRNFVHGLVASEDFSHQMATDQRKMANSKIRIEGAIRDCSRARHELVTMQKTLASVSHLAMRDKEHSREVRKKNIGEDYKAKFQFPEISARLHHEW